MICPNCRREVSDGTKGCGQCGRASLAAPAPRPRINPALFLRLCATFIFVAVALSLIMAEGCQAPFCWALVVVYLLWFPWKPVRMLAALALIPLVALAAFMAVVILAGGPDSRGGGAAVVPLLLVLLAFIAGVIWLCVAEWRAPQEPSRPASKRALAALAHIMAIAFIARAFVKSADRLQDMARIDAGWQEQQKYLEQIKALPESERPRFEQEYALAKARNMGDRQWRAQEEQTRAWVRERAMNLPDKERARF